MLSKKPLLGSGNLLDAPGNTAGTTTTVTAPGICMAGNFRWYCGSTFTLATRRLGVCAVSASKSAVVVPLGNSLSVRRGRLFGAPRSLASAPPADGGGVLCCALAFY